MKDKIVVIGLLFIAICLGVSCVILNDQNQDCVQELDAFKQYHDAVEDVFDNMENDSVDLLDTYLEGDAGSDYMDASKRLERIYNRNHKGELKLNEKIVDRSRVQE